MSDPILYGLSRSVYTRTARLTLEEKAARYTLEEVEIFGSDGVPASHLERQPFGRIPAFVHDGFSLYETSAITRYVDEAFAGAPLQPQTPHLRARMNQVIGIIDSYAYRPMIWGVFVPRMDARDGRAPLDAALLADSMAKAQTCCRALEGLLGEQRYFAGSELSLADLHAAPILMYFAMTPEGTETLAVHPRLRRWLTAMIARPSMQRTRSTFEQAQ